MTITEICKKEHIDHIVVEVRYNSPLPDIEPTILFGFCEYNHGELKSLDGDSYSLEEEFDRYEVLELGERKILTVYGECEWMNG